MENNQLSGQIKNNSWWSIHVVTYVCGPLEMKCESNF
ncbi:unnamed protein product [Brassica oleracea var. botrytis]